MIAVRQDKSHHVNYPLIQIPWRGKFMSMNNNNNLFHKTFTIDNPLEGEIICYARNCNRIAVSTLILTAGSKQIPIYVCAECKSKFE